MNELNVPNRLRLEAGGFHDAPQILVGWGAEILASRDRR